MSCTGGVFTLFLFIGFIWAGVAAINSLIALQVWSIIGYALLSLGLCAGVQGMLGD